MKPSVLLQPLPIPDQVCMDSSMDFIFELPRSLGKDINILVVNRFNKYSHFTPMAHPFLRVQVAQAYLAHVFEMYFKCVKGDDPIEWCEWL